MEFKQGLQFEKNHEKFTQAIQESVTYRGDVTLHLDDQSSLEGYVFDFTNDIFYVYSQEGDKKEINLSNITKIDVTGKDPAEGKSWEAWVAKKKAKE